MYSAFQVVTKRPYLRQPDEAEKAPDNHRPAYEHSDDENETEDEEVKLNCMGGARGVDESDMNSSFWSDDETDDESASEEEDVEEESPHKGDLVNFVSSRPLSDDSLVRPRATSISRLSPFENKDMADHEDEVETEDILAAIEDDKIDMVEDGCEDGGDQKPGATDVESAVLSAGVLSDSFDEESVFVSRDEISSDEEQRVPPAKRDFSSLCEDSPASTTKRLRWLDSEFQMVPFSLGEPALGSFHPAKSRHLHSLPCDEDEGEDLDGRLREELDGCSSGGGDNSPVPLLTPPSSPCTEKRALVCEWPSNLTIDNAMTAVITEIRPLSPDSLVQTEDFDLGKVHSSTLTPLLNGMVVRRD